MALQKSICEEPLCGTGPQIHTQCVTKDYSLPARQPGCWMPSVCAAAEAKHPKSHWQKQDSGNKLQNLTFSVLDPLAPECERQPSLSHAIQPSLSLGFGVCPVRSSPVDRCTKQPGPARTWTWTWIQKGIDAMVIMTLPECNWDQG